MKVVGISGSTRKDGNTAIIIRTVFEELEKEGITTELIQLCDKKLTGCIGCMGCAGKGRCILKDDDFGAIFDKVAAADGVILGSPVYSADVSALMKAYLERAGIVVSKNPGLLRRKAGAAVVATRRGAAMPALDTLTHNLLNKEMLIVGSGQWNVVYGRDPGDVLKDQEGMDNMHRLGVNMAWLLNHLAPLSSENLRPRQSREG